MATHSSILAWEIPWTEDPSGLQSVELQRVRHGLATKQQQQIRYRTPVYSEEHLNISTSLLQSTSSPIQVTLDCGFNVAI